MKTDLPRTLGLLDALAIVIGCVIGGGIFLVPNLIAQNLPFGALDSGRLGLRGRGFVLRRAGVRVELGAAIPSTGGQYVFLREAFGPLAGFLCGWTNFLIARGAQSAWLAVVLSIYISYFHPFGPAASKAISVAAIALFTWVNYRGVTLGALVQKSFALAKLAGILIIVASAFFLGHSSAAPTVAAPPITLSSFGVALIACLLAYDGWVQMSFVAGEIKNPKRNILLALAFGIAAVVTVYLLANAAYLRVLSVPEIAASTHVGADAATRALGSVGGTFVSTIILLSIIGSLNGAILTCPRVYFAQAQDGLFLPPLRRNSPALSDAWIRDSGARAVWATVLILSGSAMRRWIDYAMFAIWLSYAFMIAGVMVLRRTQPDLPRPYKMWGYPLTPLLFLAVATGFLGNMLITRPGPSLIGVALIAAGVPVYFVWRRVSRDATD